MILNLSVTYARSNIAYRDFWHPNFLGKRLDYCSLDGIRCGKKVANQYCKILGYDYASKFKIAYNLGWTHFLGTKDQCRGWRCNGFMNITCAVNLSEKPLRHCSYNKYRFVAPRYNDYRVDWCYEKNRNCGKKSAYSFCSRMGYMQAKSFIQEPRVNATKTIGSQQLCYGPRCNAFKEIVCSR